MVSDQPSGQSRGVRGLRSPVGCPRSPGLGAGWSTATGTQGRAAPGHCQASPSVKENSQLCSRQELVSAGTSSTMSPPPRSCFPAREVPRHGFFGCVPVEGLEGTEQPPVLQTSPYRGAPAAAGKGGTALLSLQQLHTHTSTLLGFSSSKCTASAKQLLGPCKPAQDTPPQTSFRNQTSASCLCRRWGSALQ